MRLTSLAARRNPLMRGIIKHPFLSSAGVGVAGMAGDMIDEHNQNQNQPEMPKAAAELPPAAPASLPASGAQPTPAPGPSPNLPSTGQAPAPTSSGGAPGVPSAGAAQL